MEDLMKKVCCFYVDDVIFTMRAIAEKRPKSLFDDPYMGMLKKGHDETGVTVQLNLFYRTDFFYGSKEFTLSDMPDCYKSEFEANSDWLKLAFHAKQEFPDYPYVNADYEDVKMDCEAVHNEIIRFAGEKSLSRVVCPHWLPISKDGCRALADCGIKFTSVSQGERTEFNGDHASLPYGHSFRLLQNRKPETMLFTRGGKNTALRASICGYNHVDSELYKKIHRNGKCVFDKETGIGFCAMGGTMCLNLETVESIKETVAKLNGEEYLGIFNHEEYFYSDYYAYQPDYPEKFYLAARLVKEAGYEFKVAEDIMYLAY